jgi:hypothetical protein
MTTCFNTLNILLPSRDIDRILAAGFQNRSNETATLSPQHFKFDAFVNLLSSMSVNDNELRGIWVNWIKREHSDHLQENMTIEFETEGYPPVAVIDTMIEWMKHEHIAFQLKYSYRLENEQRRGTLEAVNEVTPQ